MYYPVIGTLAMLVLLLENQDILIKHNESFNIPSWKVYRKFLFAVLFYYITDILWGVLEAEKLATALYWDTVIYFIAMAIGLIFWSQYVITYLNENNAFGRFVISACHTVATLIIITCIVNSFVPILFTIDENSVYHATAVRYILLFSQILILILISVYAFISSLKRDNAPGKDRRYHTVTLFGIIMACFLTIQLQFPYLPLYSVAYMLGTCLLRAFVIGEEKDEYRSQIDEAVKIKALKHSITALLDNMPALSFSKDAVTGVYIACNQAFAEYAHKSRPEEVTGLTDADIFDKETAIHFAQDDAMALSMDRPYIFYEDVRDPVGNARQFQTTKLKFIDANGKLCILGMCQDVTDMVRIQRESAINKEAYEQARSTGIIYTHIAQTLARGYENLYYVNTETEEFIEYYSEAGSDKLIEKRRGENFFDECVKDARTLIHPEDYSTVLKALDKKTLLDTLDKNQTFVLTYRLLTDGDPMYVTLRTSRMEDDDRFIILGVTNVDEEMKQRRAVERLKDERIAYSRLNALSGNFIAIYVIDPETDHYQEYSSSIGYKEFEVPDEGEDFFTSAIENGRKVVHPDDLDKYLSSFSKESIMSEIEQNGIYHLRYRIILNGSPLYVLLKAALVYEDEGARLIVGLNDVDSYVRHEEETAKRLAMAQTKANVDALTGVRNKHAYLDEEKRINELIEEGMAPDFAIVILDVNDLKKVNDLEGHKAGDTYLCNAVKIVCDVFKHSPVFRVGGDEFAVIVGGDDYSNLETLLGKMSDHNAEARRSGGIVIACGMSRFNRDNSVSNVYDRADSDMYDNKAALKGLKGA